MSQVSSNTTPTARVQSFLGRHWRFWIFGGLAAVVVVGFIWFLFQPSGTTGSPGTLAIGQTAPNFTLSDTTGKKIALAQFKGHPVMLNFWATTCGPCASETPLLQRTETAHGAAGLVVVGIDQGEEMSAIAKFGQDYGLTYPLLADIKLDVNHQFGVTALPVTYFIDANGIIRSISNGVLESDSLDKGLKAIGVSA